jgi:glucokinase
MIIESSGPICNCGKSGCLEALASGSAMAKEAMKRLEQGEPSVMTRMTQGGIITGELIAAAAKQGDMMACAIVTKAASYLGVGLANLTNIFDPDMIVIGGGLSNMGRMLLAPAKKVAKEIAFKLPAKRVRIVKACLGADAGIIGIAAYLFGRGLQGGEKA